MIHFRPIFPGACALVSWSLLAFAPLLPGCGSSSDAATSGDDAGADGGLDDLGKPIDASSDAVARDAPIAPIDAPSDAPSDGSSEGGDVTSTSHPARYATKVVSSKTGDGGGFNADKLPDIVLGSPQGKGLDSGSTDVFSLGNGGEIVLGFDVTVIDGAGVDFIVFENAFRIGGSATNVFYELGEVSVSDDGVTWTTFPCTATTYPFGSCAGWHPVLASPAEPVDVTHPELAGGDAYDLSDVGVKSFHYLRVRDMMTKRPATGGTGGFDLDAVAVIHGDPAP